jgi:hypothetical protein
MGQHPAGPAKPAAAEGSMSIASLSCSIEMVRNSVSSFTVKQPSMRCARRRPTKPEGAPPPARRRR